MNPLIKSIATLALITLLGSQGALAFAPKETNKYFNGPTVSSVTENSAKVSLSSSVLADLTTEEKLGVYFEYGQTHQVCIMIYPTPEYCLPKKTEIGKTSVVLTNLKPNTSYTVSYKRDNTIRCITAPCPGNEFESLSVEFTTKDTTTPIPSPTPTPTPTPEPENETQVNILQKILIAEGYLKTYVTGFFDSLTKFTVREFQKALNIIDTYINIRQDAGI